MTTQTEIREGVRIILDATDAPLTTVQLVKHLADYGVHATTTQVAQAMHAEVRKPGSFVRRTVPQKVLTGPDRCRYAYYDKRRFKVERTVRATKPESDAPGVNAVNFAVPTTLDLKPIPDAMPSADQPAADPQVIQGTKAITVQVAGVTIKIELTC